MKLVIVSNYINHHMQPLCRELYGILGDGFAFVETVARQDSGDTFRLGYAYWMASESLEPWVIRGWQEPDRAKRAILDADAVLTMNCSDNWVLPRLKAGKLTFRAHERWHRNPLPWYRMPRAVAGSWLHHGRFSTLHLLAASAYGAADAARIGCFRGKAYQWGYFPEFRAYTREQLEERKAGSVPKILWAGRFLGWKHPEDALLACRKLWEAGYEFRLSFAGSGPMESELRRMAGDQVQFLGVLTPDQLRDEMEHSDIFVMTSDFQEGWGVVLNEAMNSGCAVVSSHGPGGAPWLISDGENGMLYPSGDVEVLTERLRNLLEDPCLRRELGWHAYETIRESWTPAVAAERLVALCRSLLSGGGPVEEDGPCSTAKLLKNSWYSKKE